ncbi:hypothetical protein BLA24_03870, partial [Streptomyces cinnamoneus]
VLSVLASLWLMLNLPAETWARFAVWMLLGVVVYFVYGRRNSRVRQGGAAGAAGSLTATPRPSGRPRPTRDAGGRLAPGPRGPTGARTAAPPPRRPAPSPARAAPGRR